MAKRPKPAEPDDPEIEVVAAAGFKHRGMFVRTGELARMTRAEARDLLALNMARVVERADG